LSGSLSCRAGDGADMVARRVGGGTAKVRLEVVTPAGVVFEAGSGRDDRQALRTNQALPVAGGQCRPSPRLPACHKSRSRGRRITRLSAWTPPRTCSGRTPRGPGIWITCEHADQRRRSERSAGTAAEARTPVAFACDQPTVPNSGSETQARTPVRRAVSGTPVPGRSGRTPWAVAATERRHSTCLPDDGVVGAARAGNASTFGALADDAVSRRSTP
jgi:hypothetical protein